MTSTILNIKLSQCDYDIFINDEKFDFDGIAENLNNRKIAIISNDVVAPLYLSQVKQSLSQYNDQIFTVILPDGEHHKNLQSYELIMNFLAEHQFNRTDLLVSLGGGVICDMTGFAAACWMRGIDFIQVPTSLLSQVDASVGGKTGVNHEKGKNLIGAFHQPIAVIINTSTLKTLPAKEYQSGLGEVIKYAFINQIDFKEWLKNNCQSILQQDANVLTSMVAKCCEYKADIVEQDEKESGVRALLNLGHTFGHAIETYTGYDTYAHGEAVAIGMVMAAELSELLNVTAVTNLRKELEKILQDFHLQTMLPVSIDANALVRLMRLDKKVINNKHRLILLKDVGKAYIQRDVCEEQILQAIINCQH